MFQRGLTGRLEYSRDANGLDMLCMRDSIEEVPKPCILFTRSGVEVECCHRFESSVMRIK